MTKKTPKLISTKVDLSRPDLDELDPISWYEMTGEDIGLPSGYLEKVAAGEAKARARLAEQRSPS